MLIKPNKSILKGRVSRVERAPEGWGANVEFAVDDCAPAKGYADFVDAKPGSTLTVFTAEPDTIRPGKAYTLIASVLGGPQGERVVVEDARARDD